MHRKSGICKEFVGEVARVIEHMNVMDSYSRVVLWRGHFSVLLV